VISTRGDDNAAHHRAAKELIAQNSREVATSSGGDDVLQKKREVVFGWHRRNVCMRFIRLFGGIGKRIGHTVGEKGGETRIPTGSGGTKLPGLGGGG